MDISNIAAMYSDKYAVAANQSAQKLQDKINGKDYSNATDQELLDACKEFEAYLLEQVFKEMTKTTSFVDKDSAYGNLIDFFGDNVIQEMCKQSTQSQGLGIAEQLYEQMKRNYNL